MEKLSLWVIVFVIALLVPTHLSIDFFGVRLSAYRLVLLLSLISVTTNYLSLRNKWLAVDLIVALFSVLMGAAMIINNGQAGFAFGASIVLETSGPYFLARAFIRHKYQFHRFAYVYLISISCVSFPVVYETLTGNNMFGIQRSGNLEQRLGLHRAFGPMDHPILFGLFVASGICIAYGSFKKGTLFYVPVLITSIASVSSAAFLMVGLQVMMLRFKILASAKLKTYGLILLGSYIFIDLFSNRSPLAVLASYLSLDQSTAYFRIMIYENVLGNIRNNMFFGIGLNEWARPEWMGASVDSFYFVIALRYGLPALGLIFLIIFYALKATYLSGAIRLSVAYRILLMSLVISIFSVHIWNSMYVFFWFVVGVCVNLQFISDDPSGSAEKRDTFGELAGK